LRYQSILESNKHLLYNGWHALPIECGMSCR